MHTEGPQKVDTEGAHRRCTKGVKMSRCKVVSNQGQNVGKFSKFSNCTTLKVNVYKGFALFVKLSN